MMKLHQSWRCVVSHSKRYVVGLLGVVLMLGWACAGWPSFLRPAPSSPSPVPEALTVTALAQQLAAQQGGATPTPLPPLVISPSPAGGTPPAFPNILPTIVPTRLPTGVPTLSQATQSAPVPPSAGIAVLSEVWDFPSGDHLRKQGNAYVGMGGDVYASNLYERPFREQSQDTFFPDLDLRYARLMRQGDWYFAGLRIHGLNPGESRPTGYYGIEIDVDVDGRGEFLVWVSGPLTQQWVPQGVTVYQDVRVDVEGPWACRSDAPFRGDGYDHVVYRADPKTALAWVRWTWVEQQGKRYPEVQIAFHRSTIGSPQDRFLWQAWADGVVRQPEAMAYHDRYTRPEAGVPYPGDVDFPVKSLARMDNTCRAAFGFEPTGTEPCLCRNQQTAPVCPEPQDPPYPECEEGPGRLWSCYDEQEELFYCRWDDELCNWDCRRDQICPGPEDIPMLPFTSLPTPTETSDVANMLPSISGQPAQFPGGGLKITLPGENNTLRTCRWDVNLCRWDCREEDSCPIPEAPRPGCTYQGDDTWVCPDEPKDLICRWDRDACRWDCTTKETCPPPSKPPAAGCQEQNGQWTCSQSSEIGLATQICTWDDVSCQWSCQSTCPEDDTCTQRNDGKWVCPGKGVFEGCRWDADQCRWRCWNPEKPRREDDEPECQPKDYCSYDPPLWYCENGSFEQCTYDGCRWICE